MKCSRVVIGCVVAVAIRPDVFAAERRMAPKTNPSAEEPFLTFRMLDEKLTLLGNQQHSLQAALDTNQSNSRYAGAAKQPWAVPARAMLRTAVSIKRLVTRREHLYRIRHRQFGIRLFSMLRTRAEAVRRNVVAVERARNRVTAESVQRELDKAILSLIVQFQGASGGYGATRCPPQAWTCCEPKRAKDLQGGEQAACRWICVQKSQSCTGFVGPRIR
jgi:hypothetical protein